MWSLADQHAANWHPLTFASVRMFKALGVWESLAPHAQPIDDILVTDAKLGGAPSPFSLHFDHRELGQPLGTIAENRHIRQALFAASRTVKKDVERLQAWMKSEVRT